MGIIRAVEADCQSRAKGAGLLDCIVFCAFARKTAKLAEIYRKTELFYENWTQF